MDQRGEGFVTCFGGSFMVGKNQTFVDIIWISKAFFDDPEQERGFYRSSSPLWKRPIKIKIADLIDHLRCQKVQTKLRK